MVIGNWYRELKFEAQINNETEIRDFVRISQKNLKPY